MATKANIQADQFVVAFLERRGARSQRGGREFSWNAVMRRSFQGLRALVELSDPRATRGMVPAVHAAVLALLPAPWKLSIFEIQHLDQVLAQAPELSAVLAAAGLEPDTLLGALRDLTFAERFALVDQAVQAHAPAAAATTPEEP